MFAMNLFLREMGNNYYTYQILSAAISCLRLEMAAFYTLRDSGISEDHHHVYGMDYRYSSNTISQMVQDYGGQDVIVSLQIYNATTKNVIPKLLNIGQFCVQ